MDSEIIGKTKEEETGGQMTFFEHLIELRKRIINSLIAIAVCAAGGWFLAPKVVELFAEPIQVALKAHGYNPQLIYTDPTDYLGLLIKLSIYIGLVISSPVVLYQVWMFVAPALYKHERSAVVGFVFSTVVLFLGGIAFGFFLALPHILGFLVGFQGPGSAIAPMIHVNSYIDLAMLVIVALGLVFELPVLIFLLCYFGIVTPKFLVQNTKYAVLGITVVSAIVTPTPDALTMLLVMGVMLALYFLGVGISWIALRKRTQRIAAEARGTT
ncbi:MAG: twin-arginine translocase subunit TatC [Acidobacteria bacterium]|nr:twin-arginine translocase subunit TatC [Acidobacteriota bacterium]MBS1866536.1 twin-arginine translocase subunit TatC [Acidobacteriota bacterium]